MSLKDYIKALTRNLKRKDAYLTFTSITCNAIADYFANFCYVNILEL